MLNKGKNYGLGLQSPFRSWGFSYIIESVLHLLFPHVCEGCGGSVVQHDQSLCLRCHASLPCTEFHLYPANPIENIFRGRLPISCATAQYYFSKKSTMQNLMHGLKYKGNKELGLYLGAIDRPCLNRDQPFSYGGCLGAVAPVSGQGKNTWL